ncbi:carbohydrate kinase [Alloacidobacterium dinghuense]|uniref:Carbohydrate kinase n=1 Tax=Alloacidobacterium dinghuense TaxID=2763107 RepID=A0A7G8BK59_9BACT|nr:FGGY-family carbohydrate kinase [Alloacidobacterium dinghuense]QNI32929.1 carbohydrate kinase [Alloacidobacterium dinghuense]
MPDDLPSIVAIDLGAESCRVSLLRWDARKPRIELVHRFSNAPVEHDGGLYWNLDRICAGLDEGLDRCAQLVDGQVASIGVDGWAVDYVRLQADGTPIGAPHCYRDIRNEAAEEDVRQRISPEEMFALSGVQPLRINTLNQLVADRLGGVAQDAPWVNLPEYVLMRLGGERVAEFSNATHTGLVDATTKTWNKELFERSGLDMSAAPSNVSTGEALGEVRGQLAQERVFAGARLIAPCCHDTASAVAGIPILGDDWAYISSGTWSLVGALLDHSVCSREAFQAGFTNLGAAGGQICFHKNVNGMWLLKQCLAQLCPDDKMWPMLELVAAAESLPAPKHLLDVDDPELLLHGNMASRINVQLERRGLAPLDERASAMPQFASLIFHSLAARYAEVLKNAAAITGKKLKRLSIVGGGSLNQFLNRLTSEATGLELTCGVAESSTVGNFAIQLAVLESAGGSRERIAHWAGALASMHEC